MFAFLALTGCGTIDKVENAILERHEVPVVSTNATGQTTVSTNLFFSPDQRLVKGIQTGQEIASAIPGYGTIVSTGLGLLLSGVTFLAKRKTEAQLKTVIRGVESAAESGTVKASIAKEAASAGVFDALHDAVQLVTAK